MILPDTCKAVLIAGRDGATKSTGIPLKVKKGIISDIMILLLVEVFCMSYYKKCWKVDSNEPTKLSI